MEPEVDSTTIQVVLSAMEKAEQIVTEIREIVAKRRDEGLISEAVYTQLHESLSEIDSSLQDERTRVKGIPYTDITYPDLDKKNFVLTADELSEISMNQDASENSSAA